MSGYAHTVDATFFTVLLHLKSGMGMQETVQGCVWEDNTHHVLEIC